MLKLAKQKVDYSFLPSEKGGNKTSGKGKNKATLDYSFLPSSKKETNKKNNAKPKVVSTKNNKKESFGEKFNTKSATPTGFYSPSTNTSAGSPTLMQFEITQKNGADKASDKWIKENINKPSKSKVDNAIRGVVGSFLDNATFGVYNRGLEKKYGKAATRYQTGPAKYAGMALSMLTPGGIEALSSKAISKLAPNLIKQGSLAWAKKQGKKALVKELGKRVTAEAAKGTLTGAGYGVGNVAAAKLQGEEISAKDALKNIGLSALVGAGAGAGLGSLAGGIKASRAKASQFGRDIGGSEVKLYKPTPTEKAVVETPAISTRKPTSREVMQSLSYASGKGKLPEPMLALPPGPAKSGIKAIRDIKVPNQFSGKFEALVKEAERLGIQDKPGRNFENWNSLWSRIADRQDPSLMELVNIANKPATRNLGVLRLQGFNQTANKLAGSVNRGFERARTIRQNPEMFGGFSNKFIKTAEKPRELKPINAVNSPEGKFGPQSELKQRLGLTNEPVVQTTAKPEVKPTATVETAKEPVVAEPQSNKPYAEPKFTTSDTSTDINELTFTKNKVKESAFDIKKIKGQIIKERAKLAKKPKDPKILSNIALLKGELKVAQDSLDYAKLKLDNMSTSNLHFNESDYTKENIKNFAEAIVENIDTSKIKNMTSLTFTDVYRILENAFAGASGKDNAAARHLIRELLSSKDLKSKIEKDIISTYKKDFFEKNKFRPGSKESAAIEKFGEKLMSEDELVAEFGAKKASEIKRTAEFMRKVYDDLLKKMNESIIMLEGEGSKNIIRKRSDYFHHIVELENTSGFRDVMGELMGMQQKEVSKFSKPTIKTFGFMKKRTSENHKPDAIAAFLNYVPEAAYTIAMNRQKQMFRSFSQALDKDYKAYGSANDALKRLSNYFEDYAKELEGNRFSYLDKSKRAYKAANTLNSKLGRYARKAALFFKASTGVMQFGNVPLAYGEAGFINSAKGLGRLIIESNPKFAGETLASKSQYLRERGMHLDYLSVGKSVLKDPEKFARWYLDATDFTATKMGWYALYEKGVAKGVQDPIKFADDWARKTMPSRELGDMPLAYSDPSVQMFAPFAYEPMNQFRVYRDLMGEKRFVKFAQTLIAVYAFNQLVYELTGRKGSMDLLGAGIESYKSDGNAVQKGGRIAGEVLSNVPGGQYVTQAFIPETGFKVGGQTLTRKEIFGGNDPTRYGVNPMFISGIVNTINDAARTDNGTDAVKSVLSGLVRHYVPGGSQAYTTTEGVLALTRGAKIKNDKLYYPVKNNPENVVKSTLFGPSATKEGKKFYKDAVNIPQPFTPEQTKEIMSSKNLVSAYEKQMMIRKLNTLANKYDQATTQEEKNKINEEWRKLRSKIYK